MRLIEHGGGRIVAGRIRSPIAPAGSATSQPRPQEAMRQLRGAEIAMIFQEPMTSLNPVLPIGDQIAEAMMLHQGTSRAAARRRRSGCSSRCAFPKRRCSSTAIRTSFPAACGSA